MFLNYPNQYAPKVLFVDSSDILLGAVLFDMEWPKPRNMGEECVYDIREMRLRHRNINKELEELSLPLFVSRTFPKKNSSFFESVMHVILEMQVGNIPTTAKLLRQAVMLSLIHISEPTTPY